VFLVVAGGGPEIVAVKFVEAGAAQAELVSGDDGGDFVPAEGREEFTDQRCPETMGELTVMFFIAARMRVPSGVGEFGVGPAGLKPASAPLRPASGPQGRACSPLRAHLSGFARTLFAFARNATVRVFSGRVLIWRKRRSAGF
jgi:hypothetical protein